MHRVDVPSSAEQLARLHAFNPAFFSSQCLLQSQQGEGFDLLFAEGELRGLNSLSALEQGFVPQSNQHPDLPCQTGWLVYLGYELAAQFEPRLHLPPSPLPLPEAALWYCPLVLVHSHASGLTSVLADDERLLALGVEALAMRLPSPPRRSVAECLGALQQDDPQAFLAAVAAAQAYIASGDIYQANLSRRWQVPLLAGVALPDLAWALYEHLRWYNPAPFSAWLKGASWQLLSASPERLLRVQGDRIDTRPIAGTHPRTDDLADLAQKLRAHPKERAEHIMLVDLERNDLGRLCVAGSVRVDELLSIEDHPSVHHLVSNISGQLRPDTHPADVLRALFPGGTITGCPKVRAMQIIGELEGVGRGAYTGSLGYVSNDGRMDFNILIRTLVATPEAVHLQTGAGIVADSIPDKELAETHAKAKGLLRALGRL
jgi:anthranilate synthase component 1